MNPFRSGFFCFVGRPNVGKSTLINRLVGRKVAITSRTAQTTRKPLRAIVNGPDYQLILIDTAGLHKPKDLLGGELNRGTLASLEEADGIVMVASAIDEIGKGDEWVAASLVDLSAPKFFALSKADRADKTTIARQMVRARELGSWRETLAVSGKTGRGVEQLRAALVQAAEEGPAWFPTDAVSDEPLEMTLAEITREKVMRLFRDEVPHSASAVTDELSYDEAKNLWRVHQRIFVERESQKAMLIGAKGSSIKRIGSYARQDMEKLLAGDVYLDLKVEVRPRWRKDLGQIQRFGYGSP